MRTKVRLRHDMNVRTNDVCTEHSDIFDADPGGKSARGDLPTEVSVVQEQLGVQERSITERRSATVLLEQLRRILREGDSAIVKVGRRVTLPEPVMAAMVIPPRMSDDQLAAFTRGQLDHVTPYADAFAEKGLPVDLLKTLAATLDRFTATKSAQNAARQRFAGAATIIRESQLKTKKTVDALVAFAVNTPAARPVVLEKLRTAKRIGPRREDPTPKPGSTPEGSAAPPAATKSIA